MKKIALAMILSLALVASMAAQGQAIDSQGSFGLQFTMQGLGTFGVTGNVIPVSDRTGGGLFATEYYGIGAKYFVISKLAVGLDVYMGGSSDNGDTTFMLGLKPFVTYSLVKKGPVGLYAGAYFSYGAATTKTGGGNPSYEDSVVGYGLLLGSEYFILNGLSLGAEYTIGGNTYNEKYTNAAGTVTTASSSDWGVGVVSVYVTFYL